MNNKAIFDEVCEILEREGFEFERTDFNRPWGGFFVIKEKQASKFIKYFFAREDVEIFTKGGKVSPKILVVAPGKRLSWQYHHRRSEVWRLIDGDVGIVRSMTDEQGDVKILNTGEVVILQQGERHRLVGLEQYGVIAEIWQHTDSENPSNEDDIVRLQDDFNRK